MNHAQKAILRQMIQDAYAAEMSAAMLRRDIAMIITGTHPSLPLITALENMAIEIHYNYAGRPSSPPSCKDGEKT